MKPSTGAIQPLFAYEVTLNSGLEKRVNAITHRLGVNAELASPSGLFNHTLTTTFDYGTDRGYDARYLGGTVQYSFAVADTAIGRLRSAGRSAFFVVQPYVGFTFAELQNKGERTGRVALAMNSPTPMSIEVNGILGKESPAFQSQQSAKVALAIKF